MTHHAHTRRRLDQVLDPEFVDGLEEVELDELSRRRRLADEVENELSYYRRLLHGRIDLIRFEQRRRSGEETRSLIEALPQILADPDPPRSGRSGPIVTDLPPLPEVGRREVDHVLGDDVLTRLDQIDDAGLGSALEGIRSIEREISEQRRRVQEVEDRLATVLSERYRSERSPS